MPTRLQQISEFSRQISKQITKNPTEWTSYLTFAARMYKYSFNDKLLIYAQRPDAAACASMHLWNTKLGHWIKAGSKGIALIRNNNNKPHLEYVFDVADTRPVKGAKEIKVWEISEKQQKSVIEQLEKTYSITTQGSFEQRLMDIAEHVVNSEYQEYLKNLLQTKDNSFLEELDDDNIAEAEEKQSSAFFIAQSDINHALLAGTQNKESKLKIFDFSKSPHSMKEVVELLKQEYQTGSIPFTFLDGTDGEIWTDKNGFTLKSKEEVYPAVHFSWRDTAKQIYELIEKEQYLSPSEQKEYTVWKERQDTEKAEVTKKVENSNVIPFPAKETNKNSLADSDATDKTNTIQADTSNEFLSETETPSIEAYTNLKVQYPGYLIAVQRKDQLVLYGTDAEQAATAFKTEASIENIPELGQTSVLRFPFQEWVRYGKQLEKTGHSFLFAKENGKEYEILKEQKAIDKLPIGTQIELNGRSMRIRSVSYEYDSVSLADMSRPSYMPPIYMEITIAQALSLLEEKQAQAEKKKEPSLERKQAQVKKEKESPPLSPKRQQMLADIMEQGLLDKTAMNEYLNRNPDGNGFDVFLKENYNKVKKDIVYSNGQKGAFETDKNGISLLTEFSISSIDWSQAAKSIHSFYQENLYGFQALDRTIDIPITVDSTTPETATDTSITANLSAIETATDTPITVDSTALDSISENLENYHITDNELGYGGAKTKFQYNVAAIQTLKQIESENRPATPEEQEILAKYVGWGGISQAFDERNENWKKEYSELKELLTKSEYESARRTTLTSFYTSPAVSNAIYKAIKQTGTEVNRVLEPSCGTGHFFGLLPEELQKAQLYGIELDSITGRIAKQLYPKANITISDYQNTSYPDNYFDMAIGNIPFGSFKVPDKRYDKHNFSIHDYFFAKTIDKVKPGGIIAFVTSSFVMDKQNKIRAEIRAEMYTAVPCLPLLRTAKMEVHLYSNYNSPANWYLLNQN